MKDVIIARLPGASVVDLTHDISRGDVLSGAVALEDAWPWLPANAVVCAVVDPGVGTERHALAARIGGRSIVGPDNGLIAAILESGAPTAIRRLEASPLLPPPASATFHGRDLFAPAAALLARGVPLDELGAECRKFVSSPIPSARSAGDIISLTVLSIDHFGNVAFNLGRDKDQAWLGGAPEARRWRVGDVRSIRFGRTYQSVSFGDSVLYWNSANRLELAINGGSAAESYGLRRGDERNLLWEA